MKSPTPESLRKLRERAAKQLLASLRDGKQSDAIKELLTNSFMRLPQPLQNVISNGGSNKDLKEVTHALRSNAPLLRFRQMTEWNKEKNFSPETIFEKSLAEQVSAQTDKAQWANQIPIWSGICGSNDRKTSLDIGYRPSAGVFHLYELKIGSDYPLYALLELITYAQGYLIARKLAEATPNAAQNIKDECGGLLNAKQVTFSVLAPADYYSTRKANSTHYAKPSELEIARMSVEVGLADAARNFGFYDLKINVSLLQMENCNMPKSFKGNWEARDQWLHRLGCISELVRQATPI